MPYIGEHSARIHSPDKYDEFRRKNDALGSGVHVIFGIWTEDGDRKSEIQAIRFDARKFTVAEAKKWLADHDYKPISFEPAIAEDKSMAHDVERRTFTGEVRAKQGEKPGLDGHAAVFNQETVIGSWFREVILPGAFTEAIGHDDVRALLNHNPDYVLGRNKSGTLRLEEDTEGLRYEIDMPDTSYAKDLSEVVARGDVSQSSFSFAVENDEDEEWDRDAVKQGKLPLRRIKKVRLYDVSPVTFPAYEGTNVSARARDLANAADQQAIEAEGQRRRDAQLDRARRLIACAEAE